MAYRADLFLGLSQEAEGGPALQPIDLVLFRDKGPLETMDLRPARSQTRARILVRSFQILRGWARRISRAYYGVAPPREPYSDGTTGELCRVRTQEEALIFLGEDT